MRLRTDKPRTDPDRPVKPARGKRHGILTAAHNKEGQEGAPQGDGTCVTPDNKRHGLLTAAHNNEKRP